MTTFSARNVAVTERDTVATFTVTRTGTNSDLQNPSSVVFQSQDVTAKAGQDYVGTKGALAFGAGETRKSVAVALIPDVFRNDGHDDFLFRLQGFGSANCHIVKTSTGDSVQSYWMVEGTGTGVPIPDASNAGQPLTSQLDPAHLSPPPQGAANLAVPRAYIRVGNARPDANFYERVIVNGAIYQATSINRLTGKYDADPDGSPTEIGTNENFAKPRAIHRANIRGEPISDEALARLKSNNQHLDGVFLYSDKAYVVTVGGNASTVIQGFSHTHIGGESRIHYNSKHVESITDKEDGKLLYIVGTGKILGQNTDYSFTNIRSLAVKAGQSSTYNMNVSFSANFSLSASISAGINLGIKQGGSMTVDGGSVDASFNLRGDYSLAMPFVGLFHNRGRVSTRAHGRISLSVSPMRYVSASKIAGAGVAAASWALAASVAGVAGASISANANDWVTSEHIENEAAAAVLQAGFPTAAGVLGAVGLAMAIGLSIKQAVEDLVPAPADPQLEMVPGMMKLSVGPMTSLTLTPAGMSIQAPNILMSASGMLVTSADRHLSNWREWLHVGTKVGMVFGNFDMAGNMNHAGAANFNGRARAAMLGVGA